MKPSELKSFIKEAVREAIQEELKDILLEAVRTPKTPVVETYTQPTPTQPTKTSAEKRAMVESIMGDMRRGQDTLSFNSADARGMGVTSNTLQVAPGMNTSGEGSRLPEGNVGLDMIMGLMNKK